MKIGIGSTNKAKLSAVKSAFGKLQQAFFFSGLNQAEFTAIPTKTTIPDMPLSLEQIVEGAVQRAYFVFENVPDLDIALGLEGGVFPLASPSLLGKSQYFLQNWVFAYNGEKGYLGSSPALNLPEKIITAIYEEQRELAEVIDEFSGKNDVRSKEGAFGILTRNLLTRSASFEIAVINSMIPFLNEKFY